MKISVLTVGKIKEKYLRDAIAEYSKRLSRYCKLEIIEVSDEKPPDNASETVEEAIRNKEGERLLKYNRDDAYVITLEIAGEQLTSEKFAEKINHRRITSCEYVYLPGTRHETYRSDDRTMEMYLDKIMKFMDSGMVSDSCT